MIHFCFLEAERNEEGFRPIISKSIDELGITFEQAMKVCEELNGHKTIAAWMTSGSTNLEDLKTKDDNRD